MQIILETNRLLIREIDTCDIDDMFDMDADPEVHLYIENKPVQNKEQIRHIIEMVKKQYSEIGIARWAVVDKNTNEWLGWCGLKFIKTEINGYSNIYDLGYRFKRKNWGKGFATESSIAVLNYGFQSFNIKNVYATVDPENIQSKKIMQKLRFKHIENFYYDSLLTEWYLLKKDDWFIK